ncbi:MAG: DNA-directed RNA polymerase subunit omega [PVC group bacterium]|nr:DNA-directed RNA polymerase subunit omega [PVC group bacterium]
MISIPVEDLIEKTGSLFKLVVLASQRTVELNDGSDPRIENTKNKKTAAIALHEIAEGKVDFTLE